MLPLLSRVQVHTLRWILADTVVSSIDIFLAFALSFEVIAIGVIVAGANDLVIEEVMVGAVFAALIGGMFSIGAIITVATGQSGAKAIESELRTALNKHDRPQS